MLFFELIPFVFKFDDDGCCVADGGYVAGKFCFDAVVVAESYSGFIACVYAVEYALAIFTLEVAWYG